MMTQSKNKKILLFFIALFVGLFGILFTSSYPTSHSRFIDENNNALAYEVKLHLLNKGSFGDFTFDDTSTYKTLRVSFSLERNNLANADEKDVYIIEVPYGCYMSGLTNISSNLNTNRYQMTFGTAEQTRELHMVCNLSIDASGVKNFVLPVSVYEKIEEEATFKYKSNTFTDFETTNYYNVKPLPVVEYTETDLTMPVDSRLKKRVFESWISDYVDSYVKKTYPTLNDTDAKKLYNELYGFALQYIETVYRTDSDYVKLPTTPLKGLQVTYDSANNVYHYHLENNFLGYAKTIIWDDPYSIYFSTTVGSEINEAFAYHLKNAFPDVKDQECIQNYITHFSKGQGVAYLVIPNADGTYNTISGFDYYYKDDKQLYIDDRLLDYARSYQDGMIRINTALPVDMTKVSYLVQMRNSYQDKISPDVYEALIQDDSEILMLALSTDSDVFQRYFLVSDTVKKQSLLIEVSSKAKDIYNYVTIQMIPTYENMTLTLVDDSGEVKIVVSDATPADITAFINQLELPTDVTVTASSDTLEAGMFVTGATAEEITNILQQLNAYLDTLKQNSNVIIKEEDEPLSEPILDSAIKE